MIDPRSVKRPGPKPKLFSCGHRRVKTNTYVESGGRERCRACDVARRRKRGHSYVKAPEGWECRQGHLPEFLVNGHCVTCHREQGRLRHAKLRSDVIAAYGGACVCCGESWPDFLAVDHVASDGTEHRRLVGGGAKWVAWVRDAGYPPDYQLLCHNCNSAKGSKRDCPSDHNQLARDCGVSACVR